MSRSKEYLKLFLHLSRPHFLLGGFLLYGLGTAIATYLGRPIDWNLYILGQLLVTSIQMMAQAMDAFFDSAPTREVSFQSLFSGDRKALDPEHLPFTAALMTTIVSLTISATLAALLLIVKNISFLPWAFVLMGFFAAFVYNTPPVRLITRGVGEIIATIVVASFVPIFSFTLQTGELHRLLPMSTIPLAALLFAVFIASEFPDYASDLKRDRKTLMVRLGWETAMRLHNLAILFAILSFLTAYVLGLPDRVALGALISFPLAIAQIWQLNRIKAGLPPRWRTFTFSALSLFALTTYLELMGYIFS